MATRKKIRRRRSNTTEAAERSSQRVGRWSKERKVEVVLRLLRGESVEALSRELGVETYRLVGWRTVGLAGLKESLKGRKGDPLQVRLDAALKQVGELTMDKELLQERCRKLGVSPFVQRRSRS